MTGRYHTETTKIKTEFGAMYIHVDRAVTGNNVGDVTGAWISWGRKDPESKIVGLVSALSEGLNEALK